MQTQDLRKLIETAVDTNWPAFAAAHPHLAAVMDRDLLIEEAKKQIDADPAYQAALAQANLVGQIGEQAQQIAGQLIDRLLARVIG